MAIRKSEMLLLGLVFAVLAFATPGNSGLSFTQDGNVAQSTIQIQTGDVQNGAEPVALTVSSTSPSVISFTVNARSGVGSNGIARSWLKIAVSNDPSNCPDSGDPAYSTTASAQLANSSPATLCIFAAGMPDNSNYAGLLAFTTGAGTSFLPVFYSVIPGTLIHAALQNPVCGATQVTQNAILICSQPETISVALTSQDNGINSAPNNLSVAVQPVSTNTPAWLTVSSTNITAHPSGTSPLGTLTLSVDTTRTQIADITTIQLMGDQGSGELDFLIQVQPSAPAAAPPLHFLPIVPCRVIDTRLPNGTFGGPILAGQMSRDFAIPASACGIPANAQAYALNVTVVPSGPLRFLTVWPSGEPQPTVSTLNSYDGRTKANAAIIPAGSNGAISVFATDNTHVILDITGYFVAVTDTSALAFYTLPPCRIADTRGPAGALGAPFMSGGGSRDFPILSSSCNVPSNAQAYSLNFTVVPKGPVRFLTAWPTGQARPTNVSTLNAPTGTFVANAALVPAGANGDVSVFTTDDTDVVIDINGYFAPSGPGGLSLYNLTPCRVLDTRLVGGAQVLNGELDVSCYRQYLRRAFGPGLYLQYHRLYRPEVSFT